jgi:hypothetical protein
MITGRQDTVQLPAAGQADHHGLAAAARAAAALSREIVLADPDPLTMAELDDRLHRYATFLLSAPTRTLLPMVLADWRRVQAALGRRLSPTAHLELTGIAGYLSFSLGVIAVDLVDDTSARRFATLTEQYAKRLGDPLLLGTAASLDALIAWVVGRFDAALAAARRAACHPYLYGWAVVGEARAAAALGDLDAAGDALARLWGRPAVEGLRHPGWPDFGETWEICCTADVLVRLGSPAGIDAAGCAVDHTVPGSPERGWALAALAAALASTDPAGAGVALAEVIEVLGHRPSRMLAQRVDEIVQMVVKAGGAPGTGSGSGMQPSIGPRAGGA